MIVGFVIVALIWGGVIGALELVKNRLNGASAAVAPTQIGAPVYWDAPAFSFPDQDGKQVTKTDLLGHVWIADFIFTQCTSACPVLTSRMVLLQKQLPSKEVRFISFSVDPEHDTIEALKKYADLYEGDQSRWRLLRTDPQGLADVAAGMKVAVAPSGDKDNPILHSSMFLLVDTAGKVRGLYDSVDNESIDRLVSDVKSLSGDHAGMKAITAGDGLTSVERGHALFSSMSCVACHSQVRIAPPLESLYGSVVRLDDKKMVWADEAYLHESIVNPNAKVVAGYGRSMPNYQNYLSDAQVMDLVNYIKSLSRNSPGGHGAFAGASTQPETAELLTDPVCKMKVTADASAPQARFNGRTYFFCSQRCREQFLKNPANYTLTKSPVP